MPRRLRTVGPRIGITTIVLSLIAALLLRSPVYGANPLGLGFLVGILDWRRHLFWCSIALLLSALFLDEHTLLESAFGVAVLWGFRFWSDKTRRVINRYLIIAVLGIMEASLGWFVSGLEGVVSGLWTAAAIGLFGLLVSVALTKVSGDKRELTRLVLLSGVIIALLVEGMSLTRVPLPGALISGGIIWASSYGVQWATLLVGTVQSVFWVVSGGLNSLDFSYLPGSVLAGLLGWLGLVGSAMGLLGGRLLFGGFAGRLNIFEQLTEVALGIALGYVLLLLSRLQINYRVKFNYGIAQIAKGCGPVCGDCCKAQMMGSKFALVLCDGMGIGQHASVCSKTVVELVLLSLQAGFGITKAVREVNRFLVAAYGGETLTGLDLLVVDTDALRAFVVKCGAWQSFIVRGKSIDKIGKPSLPLGLMVEIEVYLETLQLNEGDTIVMVSDGVANSKKGLASEWLESWLLEQREKDPQALAELLVEEARMNASGRPRDDLSVAVVRVS